MGDLVQDLLALARMDDGHPIEPRPVELVSVAAEAVNAANLIDATFTVRLTAPNPIDLDADGGRLRQVLDNLLANVRPKPSLAPEPMSRSPTRRAPRSSSPTTDQA